MDQDHHLASSSVAWDEANDDAPLAQTSTAYSAYTSSSTAADATVAGASATTRSARPNQLVVRVLDGKTELEGTSDMFVSYLVTSASASAPSAHETDATTTTSPATTSSRRRFQDFNFLRHALVKDFPACVVPPLPDKHRMEYVVGDRFSSEFIERRRIDLERFMQRLSKHPKLSRTSLFVNFLQSTEWNVYKHKYQAAQSHNNHHSSTASTSSFDSGSHDQNHLHHVSSSSSSNGGGGGGGLLDNLSDTLLNAFTKLKKPDPRFTQIRHELDTFDEGLTSIERFAARSKTRLGHDLANDYEEFANSVQGLGYLESGMTEPLMRFERSLVDVSSALKRHQSTTGQDFLEHVHALVAYGATFRQVLKLRDQKQLDFEELSTYLSNVVTERDRFQGGHGYGMGLTSYFKEKLEGLKGQVSATVNHDSADMTKAARLQRLDNKIKELQDAVVAAQQTSTAFNDCVLDEYETFKLVKRSEMKSLLSEYARGQIEFQKKVLATWDKTTPFIKRIHVEP
ncbi:hypothetical protein JCM3766R1_000251 [Sporobolomyces carnicolor]